MFADESAFYLLPSVVRTWGKKGKPPILSVSDAKRRAHLSVASAVTTEGKLVTMAQEKAFDGAAIVRFLSHLLRQMPGKIILLWDGAAIHRCKQVKEFLAAGASERLRLIRLPAYAPELNPDEGVWGWLKRSLGNVCCVDLPELKDELSRAIKRLRARPQVIRSFFARASLAL